MENLKKEGGREYKINKILAIKPQEVRLAKWERKSNPGIRKEKGNGNSNAEHHLSMGIKAVEAEFTEFFWRALAKKVSIHFSSIESCPNRKPLEIDLWAVRAFSSAMPGYQ